MTQTKSFYHGTKANLAMGDMIAPGHVSNFGDRRPGKYVYLSELLDSATWGAELAVGEGPGRIYIVEPTGPIEDDPNLTNKRFKGNPSRSFRSASPLRVIGEVKHWVGHEPQRILQMQEHLAELQRRGVAAIEE